MLRVLELRSIHGRYGILVGRLSAKTSHNWPIVVSGCAVIVLCVFSSIAFRISEYWNQTNCEHDLWKVPERAENNSRSTTVHAGPVHV